MADDDVDQGTGWFGVLEAAHGCGMERDKPEGPQQGWTRSEVLTVLIGRPRGEVTGKGQEPRTPLIWGSTAPKSLPPFLGRSALCQTTQQMGTGWRVVEIPVWVTSGEAGDRCGHDKRN